jgi:hypothetical protein
MKLASGIPYRQTWRQKSLVLRELIARNVGIEHTNMAVECFPAIRTEELHGDMENRYLGSPDTFLIHVGINDLRRTRNLHYVMGEVYSVVTTAKSKFSHCRLVLSGVLRHRDVTWRHIGSVNGRYDWVAKTLGVSFVDPNSWIEDGLREKWLTSKSKRSEVTCSPLP